MQWRRGPRAEDGSCRWEGAGCAPPLAPRRSRMTARPALADDRGGLVALPVGGRAWAPWRIQRGGTDMEPDPREPTGDLGYDMAHEVTGSRPRPQGETSQVSGTDGSDDAA